jgi:ATP-dependent RNA helicase DHX37/DHR1
MVSERVATEMGVVFGEQVAYKVRQESNLRVASCECDVLFVTDGLLLTVLSGDDVLAEQFGAIVIDEAHERTLGTDVLLGMLSRVIKLRRTRYESGESETPPLKLVIMSATLALEQVNSVFKCVYVYIYFFGFF